MSSAELFVVAPILAPLLQRLRSNFPLQTLVHCHNNLLMNESKKPMDLMKKLLANNMVCASSLDKLEG
jgi:hypothetical protein